MVSIYALYTKKIAAGEQVVLNTADSATLRSVHPITLKHELICPMNRLFNSKMFEEATEENFFTLQNNNYGKYSFQGVFITNTNDTIVSNVIEVMFMLTNKILVE